MDPAYNQRTHNSSSQNDSNSQTMSESAPPTETPPTPPPSTATTAAPTSTTTYSWKLPDGIEDHIEAGAFYFLVHDLFACLFARELGFVLCSSFFVFLARFSFHLRILYNRSHQDCCWSSSWWYSWNDHVSKWKRHASGECGVWCWCRIRIFL